MMKTPFQFGHVTLKTNKTDHLHSNLSQFMTDPIFATKHWINIPVYIENLVVKILIIMELPMRLHVHCKLDHDDEESIEGRYKAGSYFIKCEQREIEIVA